MESYTIEMPEEPENIDFLCLADDVADCAPLDTFSQQEFTPNDLIKFYFPIPGSFRKYVECYYIEDIFKWIFTLRLKGKPLLTPTTRTPVSESQVNRLHDCYFSRPNRTFNTFEDFEEAFRQEAGAAAAAADIADREEFLRLYGPGGLELEQEPAVELTEHEIALQWVHDMFPGSFNDEEASEVANDIYNWLRINHRLDLRNNTMNEILANNTSDLLQYLSDSYADLADITGLVELIHFSGITDPVLLNRALQRANGNFNDALSLLMG
jgi:hypothetical protein